MCKSPLHPLLVALPKVEHHLHIEGSLSPEFLFALAARNNIPLPAEDPAYASVEALYARYAAFTSLDDFLGYHYTGMRFLITAADFEELAYRYFQHVHETARVRHAEIFFDPQMHTARGVSYHTVIEGLKAGQRRAEAEFGLTSLVTPCLLRHLPVSDSAAMWEEIKASGHFADGTLAGLGLCSTEKAKPPAAWADIFVEAKALGIRRTVHAGEEGPAQYVVDALDKLGAMRIDHGVRAAEDAAVLKRLVDDGIMLTVCPISNVALKVFKDVSEGPIRKLLDAGVKFSINSDDPGYFGGYIQENYCAVEEAFGLSLDEWEGVVRDAILLSWAEEERKQAILGEIDAVLADWKTKA
ncbi:adenosine deaminase [Thozetella sp. PMI_491]|nr:adenosine deaminase [Thozetella sp. PMI_491]